jgi:stage V sporulation protein B
VSQPEADTAKVAGRGGLAIAVAKVSFLLTGFVQQLLLPAVLGVDGYGAISRVLALVSIVNNVIVATSIQGVSRTVSAAKEGEGDAAFRKVLGLHTILALVVSSVFAAGAGLLADAVGASHVSGPLRLVGAIVLLYGVYAPLVGALNGRRQFVTQAGLDIFYGVSRMVLLVAGAWIGAKLLAGRGVFGASAGFVAAALLIVPIAAWRTGLGKAGPGGPSTGEYVGFLLPLVFGQISLNLLLQTDFMLLSRAAGAGAERAGLPPSAGDQLMGVYRGVQLFAFLPYQRLMAVQFVLFPMLAKAKAENDAEAVKRYVRTGVRLAFLLVGLVAGTIAALAPHVLRFAFPELIARDGGEALRWLAPGMGAFAILGIACAALTSLRREGLSAAITVITVFTVAVAVTFGIGDEPFGAGMVLGAARGTAIAMGVCALVAAFLLHRETGAFVAPLTLVRVLVAMALVGVAGRYAPWLGKLAVPVVAAGVAVLYLALLALTGELGRADVATFKAAFGRKAKA